MRSPSRGHVRIKSRDPHQHPAILFNYMSHEQDWQEFRDAIRITREIMHQPALDKYRGREISPGVECQTDEQLDEFVRNHAETAFHPCGTCKMGYDEMAVVDGEGRVHGLEGLRVVDASIMPQIITGNLNATTIMIGENCRRDPRARAAGEEHGGVLCGERGAGSTLIFPLLEGLTRLFPSGMIACQARRWCGRDSSAGSPRRGLRGTIPPPRSPLRLPSTTVI
jgi:hypothetical protein